MEEILRYVSLIGMSGAVVSFIVGLIKWIDQRNREIEFKQYEAFHNMVRIASGIDETGKTVQMAQQLAAIYQLQAYEKYSYASIPVLEYLLKDTSELKNERALPLIEAYRKTINILRN